MKYQVLNQSNRVLKTCATLKGVANDLKRRRRAESRLSGSAVYKVERADGTKLTEDERDELWIAQSK